MNHAKRHKQKMNEHRRAWKRRGRKGGKGSAWRTSGKRKQQLKLQAKRARKAKYGKLK